MLNPDFRDMLSVFDEEGVEFLVVGAYAMAAHGLPRATGDLDFWVRPSKENADRVIRALVRFGAPMDMITVDDFLTPDLVFQIGMEPNRIDLLTHIDGVEFKAAWDNRIIAQVGGVDIPVLGLADLIRNKEAVGRLQDLADVDALKRLRPER
ncbi:MAG: nucleotidyltransferase [Gemmatimonadota bacterium]